ncbi:S-ribosylhomocysteine lyase [Georgenia sp. Z1344]
MNVESFNLDHRAVSAPYVRVADVKELPGGAVLTKYDIRFTQPNVAHLEMPVVHSLEHSVAEAVRDHADDVVDFSPMGCQTGFYLLRAAAPDLPGTMAVLADTLRAVTEQTEVPAANEVQCGWGASHSLEGAREAAAAMLAAREQWGQVMAEPGTDDPTTHATTHDDEGRP